LQKDELSLNISTGSQVSRLTDSLQLGDYQTRPFFDGQFANTFSHLPAGRSLDVLVKLLRELARDTSPQDIWEYIATSSSAVPETDLQMDLSFFPGPCGDRGTITNITEANFTVANLFRAAFDNMAQNYLTLALRLWPDRSWSRVVFSGGLARKLTILRAIIESTLESKSRMCPEDEDTLLGLMVLARVFSGRAKSVQESVNEINVKMPAQAVVSDFRD
jgi:hypothetical protein